MRISDWSSDVCSSDLQLCAVTTAVALGAGVMRLSSLAAGGLPRLEEPCSRAAELPFAVLWLFSKFRTFGPVVRDDAEDRKSVVSGKGVSVRVDLGGRRFSKKKYKTIEHCTVIK